MTVSPPHSPRRLGVLVWFWGRRGGGARVTLELARALARQSGLDVHLSLSSGNRLLDDFRALGLPTLMVDTHHDIPSALRALVRLPAERRRFADYIRRHGIGAVLSTMSHLWTPAVVDVVGRAGARQVSIIHDAACHPGAWVPLSDARLRRELRFADTVVTLSRHVRDDLMRRFACPEARTLVVPHGAFAFDDTPAAPRRHPGTASPPRPFRLLFFGRIRAYKGLGGLLEAQARLRADGEAVTLTVVGDGDLAPYRAQLERLEGVTVDNRWVDEAEVPGFLAEADAVVVPYVEASQSGVVALALAAGVPVVATPVGGLGEQVRDGIDGIVAADTSPAALADGIRRLLHDPTLYAACSAGALATARDALDWDAIARRLRPALEG